ncbi:MAG: hypothetical protein KY432_02850 [Acidobacteria bacterium]|nr:hypothetical protein [Acidobacteriota bacterium]
MGESATRVVKPSGRAWAVAGLSLGGGVVLVMATLLASFQPDPTLIDRAFPLLALSLWIFAVRSAGLRRELAMLLLPVSFAIELAVPDTQLRMLLLGSSMAVGLILHLAGAREHWKPAEMFTALATLAPVRLVEPSWQLVTLQLLLVAGGVLLWRELRRGGTGPVLTAAAVLLLTVSLPASSVRLALVPWALVLLVRALRREGWVARLIAVGVAALAASWLAVAAALMFMAAWAAEGLRARTAPAFVPSLSATVGNLPATIASLPFFPSILSSSRSLAAVLAGVVLAVVVRPSLAAPVMVVGIVAACALRERWDTSNHAMTVPSLTLIAMIALFFPWSGAIVARPPAPISLFATLAIAAVALLPAAIRSWSGVVAAGVFAAVVISSAGVPDQRREIGRALSAGESVSISLEGSELAELRVSGANLAESAWGHPVATVGVIDAGGRGYLGEVRIGDVADWAAFRPDLVLATLNPRPDEVSGVEGYGAEARVRGTGRIRFPGVSQPRWIIVTASAELEKDERVLVEEIRFR